MRAGHQVGTQRGQDTQRECDYPRTHQKCYLSLTVPKGNWREEGLVEEWLQTLLSFPIVLRWNVNKTETPPCLADNTLYAHCYIVVVVGGGGVAVSCRLIIIIIIINLIYIAQFDTNGILTALCIVITYIQMQYVHLCTYAEQSYKYTYTCLHIHTYTVTCTNIHLPTY